jgi:2-polyprenyl-6-hydroxyphenyl methylase/3-demethylubiquinone-9 3-methyltransferase
MPRRSASIAPREIEQFSRHAPDWWDETGPLAPLHRLNPVRLGYIREQAATHFKRKGKTPLKGLSALDVGCGGGLVTEPLVRLGAKVTGLDASKEAIKVAREHAKLSKLDIMYKESSVEELVEGKTRYDLITALEIAEHVADLDSFLGSVTSLLKPNGLLIMSTLNRTPKSFLLGIVAAEYILKWVPRGTHNWKKFLKPSDIARRFSDNGIELADLTGLVFHPFKGDFELRKDDLAVNYMLTAIKR